MFWGRLLVQCFVGWVTKGLYVLNASILARIWICQDTVSEWCVVCGVWCVVCGVVCGVWCVVCGVWCVVCLLA